ncbi:MAG: hypothetical protein QM655_08995 [Nocardioidaceae bacterium]
MDPNVISRRLRRRRVLTGAGLGIAGLGLASVATIVLVGARGASPETAALDATGKSAAEAVPWTATRPTRPGTVAVKSCDTSDVSLALGRTGAWHDMATQLVSVVNESESACTLPSEISAQATADNGESAKIDTADLPKEPITLAPQQAASLMVGAPGGCADSVIAKELQVGIDSRTYELNGAWVPLSCGPPRLLSLAADQVEPATQQLPLSATIEVPEVLTAGQAADFTVTLANDSAQSLDFTECPSYDVALKRSGVVETYQLNCEAAGPIPPQGSTVFQMRVTVPIAASGEDELSWALHDYPAVVSTPVRIEK